MSKKIKVLIADDHTMFLQGLVSLLENETSIEILGTACDGEGILKLLQEVQGVDVVITDISMEKVDGCALSKAIRKKHPDVGVLVLSMHKDAATIAKLLDSGATGYVLKNADKDELVRAIDAVSRGEAYFSEEVKDNFILSKMKGKPKNISTDQIMELTERELEVLRLIASEYTTSEIADKLYISLHTVETHRTNILRKLHARNTAGLIKQAIHHGLIE